MLDFELSYYSNDVKYIAGCDEAGRGPLAGPVVCAAVIFPKDYVNDEINDSKQLNEKKREILARTIKEHALAYSIVEISADEIDEINILEASRKGMTQAVKNLTIKPDLIITDYMKLYEITDTKVIDIAKGDAKSLCVAAASILAKVTRDHLLVNLDAKFPKYGFASHKGYGTKEHMDALEKYGPIKGVHRFSYAPIQKFLQVKLF